MQRLQTVVFLVRHGETDRPYSRIGVIDRERRLTEKGKRQAEKVGRFLAEQGCTAVYSSPLWRCRETAEIINKYLKLPDIVITRQLSEIYSSEPRREAGERGESIFQTILNHQVGEQVVAVTHQYIIGYIVAKFRGVGYHEVPCDFADVYRLVFAEKKLVEAMRLRPAISVRRVR